MAKIHLLETNFHKKNLLKIGLKKNLFIVGAPALEKIDYNFQNINLTAKEKIFLNEKKEKKIIACFHPKSQLSKYFLDLFFYKLNLSFHSRLDD